jgi:hypothetical protein
MQAKKEKTKALPAKRRGFLFKNERNWAVEKGTFVQVYGYRETLEQAHNTGRNREYQMFQNGDYMETIDAVLPAKICNDLFPENRGSRTSVFSAGTSGWRDKGYKCTPQESTKIIKKSQKFKSHQLMAEPGQGPAGRQSKTPGLSPPIYVTPDMPKQIAA